MYACESRLPQAIYYISPHACRGGRFTQVIPPASLQSSFCAPIALSEAVVVDAFLLRVVFLSLCVFTSAVFPATITTNDQFAIHTRPTTQSRSGYSQRKPSNPPKRLHGICGLLQRHTVVICTVESEHIMQSDTDILDGGNRTARIMLLCPVYPQSKTHSTKNR